MFECPIEAFIEKHRALLPEGCQEELRALWAALVTAYRGEVIRSAKARQEVVDATEVLKAKTELLAALDAELHRQRLDGESVARVKQEIVRRFGFGGD